jgi:polysaccharide biosynthesis protein PslG
MRHRAPRLDGAARLIGTLGMTTVPARMLVAAAAVIAVVATSGGLASSNHAQAVQARSAIPSDFYGVSVSTALTEQDYQRLAAANIRTLHVSMWWPDIATGPRSYRWLFDGVVLNAAKAGITVVPSLLGSPGFVSNDPMRPPLDSEEERALWQDFVRSAVERYGPGGEFWEYVRACPPDPGRCMPDVPYLPITVWQAWNEPNLGRFWQPTPSPDEYAELLRITSDAAHGVDPEADVITGGIMPGGPGAPNALPQNDFIAALYQRDAAQHFDGLSLNPYQRKPKQARARVQDARAVTQAYGDAQTPIWVTEIGWSIKGPKDLAQVTNRKRQAKRLAQVMKMLTAARDTLNIRLASWFTYKDPATNLCKWCHGAGLFDKHDKARPAWKKYVGITGGQD